MHRTAVLTVALAAFVLTPEVVCAQNTYRGGGMNRLQYPYMNKPAVTPWLELFRLAPMELNYYNLIKPQLDQLDVNRRTGAELYQLNRGLDQLDQKQDLHGGNDRGIKTGHRGSHGNHSHFYSGVAPAGGPTTGAVGGRGMSRRSSTQGRAPNYGQLLSGQFGANYSARGAAASATGGAIGSGS